MKREDVTAVEEPDAALLLRDQLQSYTNDVVDPEKKSAACPWLLEISYECWNQPLVQPVLDDEKVPCDPCLIDRIITRMLKGQVLHTFPAQQTWRWHAKSKRFAWLTLFFN